MVLERSLGADQLFVRQRIFSNQRKQRVPEQVGVLSVVEAEAELVKIRREMLNRELMVGAHQRPLEQRPGVLDRIGGHVAPYPFIRRVVNCLMDRVFVTDSSTHPKSFFGCHPWGAILHLHHLCRSSFRAPKGA